MCLGADPARIRALHSLVTKFTSLFPLTVNGKVVENGVLFQPWDATGVKQEPQLPHRKRLPFGIILRTDFFRRQFLPISGTKMKGEFA